MGGKKSGNVLDEDESAGPNKLIGESCELEEEAAAPAREPAAASGDAEVLAGEPAGEHVDLAGVPAAVRDRDRLAMGRALLVFVDRGGGRLRNADETNVGSAGHVGPVVAQDHPAARVDLCLHHAAHPARALEADVEAADAREGRHEVEDLGHVGLRRDVARGDYQGVFLMSVLVGLGRRTIVEEADAQRTTPPRRMTGTRPSAIPSTYIRCWRGVSGTARFPLAIVASQSKIGAMWRSRR